MKIDQIKLRQGAGNGNPNDGLCLMQAVHWFSGADNLSDHPPCASSVLCAIGIRLNDMASTQADRDSLWPLVWQLLDSRDDEAEQARLEYIICGITQRILAPLFEQLGLPDHAAALGAASSMWEIEQVAAAAEAAAEAGAAEAAEAVARAAEAAAEAAAGAAEAAAAVAARVVEATTWNELRLIFIEAIALGKHGEADPIYEPRLVQLQRILEKV